LVWRVEDNERPTDVERARHEHDALAEFVSPHLVLVGAGALSLLVSFVLLRDVQSQPAHSLAKSGLTAEA
jgi:hypothetical protein